MSFNIDAGRFQAAGILIYGTGQWFWRLRLRS